LTKIFHGIYSPMVTAFNKDESIDEAGVRTNIDYLIDNGIFGLFALGSTGEGPYMSPRERILLMKIIHDQVNNRIPVIYCVSSPSVSVTREMIKAGIELGVDGFASILTQYFVLEPTQIRKYYTDLKKTCKDFPLLFYHFHEKVPTTANTPVSLITDLANEGIISGIKYSGSKWKDFAEPLLSSLHDRDNFSFMSGGDSTYFESVKQNIEINGAISLRGNLFPRLYREIYNAASEKNIEKYNELVSILKQADPIFNFGVAMGPTMQKSMLKKYGLPITSQVRSPLPEANEIHLKAVYNVFHTLSKTGYIDTY
jgi:dihydrodipicolinate synthase/N-acetylneuraminate lyase